jgi:hypothetical protein
MQKKGGIKRVKKVDFYVNLIPMDAKILSTQSEIS